MRDHHASFALKAIQAELESDNKTSTPAISHAIYPADAGTTTSEPQPYDIFGPDEYPQLPSWQSILPSLSPKIPIGTSTSHYPPSLTSSPTSSASSYSKSFPNPDEATPTVTAQDESYNFQSFLEEIIYKLREADLSEEGRSEYDEADDDDGPLARADKYHMIWGPEIDEALIDGGSAWSAEAEKSLELSAYARYHMRRPYWLEDNTNFKTSHPPRSQHGSAGADLAHYFTSSPWHHDWYKRTYRSEPPLLKLPSSKHRLSTTSWSVHGTKKDLRIGILFSDLSICWGHVGFHDDRDYTSDPGAVEESDARYIPPPEALDESTLVKASETYGSIIAGFAESLLSIPKWCGNTSSINLVSEAFKYVEKCDSLPKPVPPIRRTYGHLIFESKVYNKDEIMGRWRGSDGMVRRGDIVHWKGAEVSVVGMNPGSHLHFCELDRAAVVVEDCVLETKPKDGEPFSPKDLWRLVVVEQCPDKTPHKKVYDMSGFRRGEMWIWRPVGMKAYLGIDALGSSVPLEEEGLKTFSVEKTTMQDEKAKV